MIEPFFDNKLIDTLRIAQKLRKTSAIAQRRQCLRVLSCNLNYDFIASSTENAESQSHADENSNNT